jgi:anti-anti-sigma factor
MEAPQCLIRFRQDDRVLTVQIHGRGTMRQAPGVRRLADCGKAAAVVQLFLDLNDCCFMDSTFLGTLLCLRRQFGDEGFCLVRPSPECRRHLEQVGLLDVLAMRETLPVPDADWITVTDADNDLGEFRTSVVQAHQALAALPGDSGEHFRSVAACLSSEAARK